LPWSVFKIESYKPIDTQKIKLDFSTNIDYDKYFWFIDWKKELKKFFIPTTWVHKLELKLMKDWVIIKEVGTEIEVESSI
jgi:hypothetical protein